MILNVRDGGLGYIEQTIFADNLSGEIKRQVLLHIIGIMKPRVNLIRVLCFDINKELQLQTLALRESGFIVLQRGGFFVWKALDKAMLNADRLFLTRLFTQGNQ